MNAFRNTLIWLAGLLSCGSPLCAQTEQPNLVSGTGTASISRPPETMRLQILILGRGGTLKDALAALKDRTAKAQTQLVALGAEKDSIQVGDVRLADATADRNSPMRMQMLMLERMQRGGKGAKKAPPASPVVVNAQLTAHWKLSGKTAEELLLAVHPIQEKVRAADLAGTKEAEKLTPEQEEMLEEAQQDFNYGGSDEPKPGEPLFIFVSQVSDAEQDQALAEAFGNARSHAARLTKAAGAKLGALKSLTNIPGAEAAFEELQQFGYNSPAYRALQLARQTRPGSTPDGRREALGVEPGPVKFNVSITAAFALEGK